MYLSLGSCVWADIWEVEWAHCRLFPFSSSHFCTLPVFRVVCHLSSVSNFDGVHRLQTTMDAVVGTADTFSIKILASFSLLLCTGSNFYYFVPLVLSLTPFHRTYQAKSECLLYCCQERNTAGCGKVLPSVISRCLKQAENVRLLWTFPTC